MYQQMYAFGAPFKALLSSSLTLTGYRQKNHGGPRRHMMYTNRAHNDYDIVHALCWAYVNGKSLSMCDQ